MGGGWLDDQLGRQFTASPILRAGRQPRLGQRSWPRSQERTRLPPLGRDAAHPPPPRSSADPPRPPPGGADPVKDQNRSFLPPGPPAPLLLSSGWAPRPAAW